MTLSMIAIGLLALVMFLFVLEPVLRARGDEVVLDAAALPRASEPVAESDDDAQTNPSPPETRQHDESNPGGRVAIDRPASSDVT
jgi:hypothetical protein